MPGSKILIVEDEMIVAMDIRERLNTLGYEVVAHVTNGDDAISKAAEENPDVILMDIIIKGDKDGVDTAQIIKEKLDIPVIFLTAHSDDATMQRAKLTEPYGYIIKPFEERELHSHIEMGLYKHRSEQKLKESEEKYREIFENLSVGIYRATLDGKILDMNPAMLNMLLIDSFDDIWINNLQLSNFLDQDILTEMVEYMRSDEILKNYECECRTTTDCKIIIKQNCRLVNDEDGQIAFFEGIVEDISAEFTLQRKLEQMAKFPLENPYPVMRAEKDGKLIYANASSHPLLKHWDCQTGEQLPSEMIKLVTEALSTGNSHEIETETEEQIFSLLAAPVIDSGYVNMYGRDITRVKKLEDNLRQIQKMEAVGQLAGGIAHDFNNILTVINGYAEVCLIDADKDAKMHQRLNGILDAGKRASGLTNKLLTFSRKQIIDVKTIDTNTIIYDLHEMLHRLVGEDIHIEYKLSNGMPNIKADCNQIEQILVNLVVNARDAIHANRNSTSKQITIETSEAELDEQYAKEHSGSKPGKYIQIAVSDTGIGMTKNLSEKIFEPFFTTKEVGKGTGLGLATVYGIVKQNLGNIYVYSEPGKGTSFRIYWPSTSSSQAHQQVEKLLTDVQKGKETILFVDDDEAIRSFTGTTLQSFGYQIYSATDPDDAIKKMDEIGQEVSLLITDVIMPGINGSELAEQLVQNYPSLKVLYISGYTGNHIVTSGVLDDSVNFIQKPYSIHDLASKIRIILDE